MINLQNSAVGSVTAEIMMESIDGDVDREFNEEIGVNLYKFDVQIMV